MLHMHGPVSAGFSFAVTSYSCKVNTKVFVILLQVGKVNFLNRQQISIIQVKALKVATYSNNSLYSLATISRKPFCLRCKNRSTSLLHSAVT